MPAGAGSQLSQFFEAWIPKRFNKEIPSILDRTEQTIKDLDSSIRTDIANRIRQLMVSNAAMDTQIMNAIDNRLAKVEGNITAIDRKITNAIELSLIPIETFGGPQIRTAIGPTFGQPPAGLINVPFPICPPPIPCKPPDEICPPPEPCPDKPPCIYVDIYKRPCKEREDICMYMVPSGHGPLSFEDITIAVEVTCDPTIGFIFEKEKYFCHELPICKMEPLPGQCCPPPPIQKPPNMIINVQPPPGGQIINEQPPINQLAPEQYPPITFPPYIQGISPGSIVNIALLNPPQSSQTQCFPSGDYSRSLLDCSDESKILDFSTKALGYTLKSKLEDKTPTDWWDEQIKDNIKESIPEIITISPYDFSSITIESE